jgi:hypothetical protein
MNPLRSLADYEAFIYTLSQRQAIIHRSTLVVIRRGATIAVLTGEVELPQGFRLLVREKLSFAQSPGEIKDYGYEVWRGEEQLYWHDSQPHPDDQSLASTHPHHKHIPPDIKHHRIPAPGLSFIEPNLPRLIEEIDQEFLTHPLSE